MPDAEQEKFEPLFSWYGEHILGVEENRKRNRKKYASVFLPRFNLFLIPYIILMTVVTWLASALMGSVMTSMQIKTMLEIYEVQVRVKEALEMLAPTLFLRETAKSCSAGKKRRPMCVCVSKDRRGSCHENLKESSREVG